MLWEAARRGQPHDHQQLVLAAARGTAAATGMGLSHIKETFLNEAKYIIQIWKCSGRRWLIWERGPWWCWHYVQIVANTCTRTVRVPLVQNNFHVDWHFKAENAENVCNIIWLKRFLPSLYGWAYCMVYEFVICSPISASLQVAKHSTQPIPTNTKLDACSAGEVPTAWLPVDIIMVCAWTFHPRPA